MLWILVQMAASLLLPWMVSSPLSVQEVSASNFVLQASPSACLLVPSSSQDQDATPPDQRSELPLQPLEAPCLSQSQMMCC